MMTLEEIASYLDQLLATQPLKYPNELAAIKNKGYKVLRNSQGKHRVQLSMESHDLFKMFGGMFQ